MKNRSTLIISILLTAIFTGCGEEGNNTNSLNNNPLPLDSNITIGVEVDDIESLNNNPLLLDSNLTISDNTSLIEYRVNTEVMYLNFKNEVSYGKAVEFNSINDEVLESESHKSAMKLNNMIFDALYETGVYNDKVFTTSDAYTLKNYISGENGDDFREEQVNFSKYINKDTNTTLFKSANAVGDFNTMYRNVSSTRKLHVNRMREMAYFISIFTGDKGKEGAFYNANKILDYPKTETSLDEMTLFILSEDGINNYLPKSEIIVVAEATARMNMMIVNAIRATGVAENNNISAFEVRTLNEYIVANNAKEWEAAYGAEGYGKIFGGWGKIHKKYSITLVEGENRINQAGNSVYKLGYELPYTTDLIYKNATGLSTYGEVSYWLNTIFKKDYENGTFNSSL